jgi:rare lipoprotein A (peptidoglycan hydrolase)
MSTRLAERQVALAAVAILAAVCAVAVSAAARSEATTAPHPEGSFNALVGSAGPAVFGRRTACGTVLAADTEGIAHPTLPCGARIFITYDGKTVLTQVVDRGPYSPGRQFDLTDALARRLDLRGVQTVQWAYAARGG